MTCPNNIGRIVGGERRIFNILESAPIKGFCKPLKTKSFSSLFP
jgi:hypothetical protein